LYSFSDRLKNAWNAFTSRDPTKTADFYGTNYYATRRPDIHPTPFSIDKSIITMIENRIAVDVAQISVHHAKTDDEENYLEDVESMLNDCFSLSANTDQTPRAFIQDMVMTMFDDGCAVAVPVETDINPETHEVWDIAALRVGKVLEWYPFEVKLLVYNDLTGKKEQLMMDKKAVAIVENPFYSIMNEPNSTLKRLVRTLRNLDILNDQNVSGKLDLIIQLPYSLRTPLKQQQAEVRRKELENQLLNSKYGIGYIDQAEKVTQLNRALDNNLWAEAQDLTAMLYNQLGLTQSIFDGTASETAMNNYYTRTIEPIIASITDEMSRKFISDEARKNGEKILFLRDPFKIVSVTNIANIAQTMSANEIMSSNEIRTKIGLKPVTEDERADELINKQINKKETPGENLYTQRKEEQPVPRENIQNQTEKVTVDERKL
jgi:hypothetical protein